MTLAKILKLVVLAAKASPGTLDKILAIAEEHTEAIGEELAKFVLEVAQEVCGDSDFELDDEPQYGALEFQQYLNSLPPSDEPTIGEDEIWQFVDFE